MNNDPNQQYADNRNPQPLRRINHRFWLSIGFLIVFLLICGASVTSVTLYTNAANNSLASILQPTSTSTRRSLATSTPSPVDNNLIQSTVQGYYEAIKQGDYDTAYNTYFDQSGSIAGQIASVPLLIKLNAQKGVLSSYTITGILNELDTDEIATAQVTVRIRRNGKPVYNVQLTLKQDGKSWKITHADDV